MRRVCRTGPCYRKNGSMCVQTECPREEQCSAHRQNWKDPRCRGSWSGKSAGPSGVNHFNRFGEFACRWLYFCREVSSIFSHFFHGRIFCSGSDRLILFLTSHIFTLIRSIFLPNLSDIIVTDVIFVVYRIFKSTA